MPNGHGPKEYGKHKYADHGGTSDCEHKCGCWMGPARSGGPVGLDPFGICPANPVDGKFLGGNQDYEHVVTERICNMQTRLSVAENKLKSVEPSKVELAEKLASTEARLREAERVLEKVRDCLPTSVFLNP